MSIQCVKIPNRMMQECPLCGENQGIMMRGLARDLEDGELFVARDRGYSFCNCRNIFFTKYTNIDKSVYDERYCSRYSKGDTNKLAEYEINKYFPIFKKEKAEIKTFLEVGSISDTVLDYVKKENVEPMGIDLIKRESKHRFIAGDFEYEYITKKQDVIYASHVFEHFKNPGEILLKCRNILSDEGLLYIAMPDTFFINFEDGSPLRWDWHVQEHHILWNMENFAEYAEEHGFKCILKERNLSLHKQVDKKSYWKKDFKVILKKCEEL